MAFNRLCVDALGSVAPVSFRGVAVMEEYQSHIRQEWAGLNIRKKSSSV